MRNCKEEVLIALLEVLASKHKEEELLRIAEEISFKFPEIAEKYRIHSAISRVVKNKMKIIPLDDNDFVFTPRYHKFIQYYDIRYILLELPDLDFEVTDMVVCFTTIEDVELKKLDYLVDAISDKYGADINIIYGFHRSSDAVDTLDMFVL